MRRTRHTKGPNTRTAKGPLKTPARAGQNRKFAGKGHSTANGADFWNREYTEGEHFSLSDKPGSELVKFTRWFRGEQGHMDLSQMQVLDVGCGNGRNLIYLADQYGASGAGFDLSESAVASARASAEKLGISSSVRFYQHNLAEVIPESDQTYELILDMMVSHCLRSTERSRYKREVLRLLQPGGFMMIKTFLREGDQHAARMMRDHPGGEPNSYIHPMIGIYEYVTTEAAFREFWEDEFIIHLLHKSHGYQHWGGVPYKRRYMVAYLERKGR